MISRGNNSPARPLCQKASELVGFNSYGITTQTATYICKQMGYESLEKVGLVNDNPFFWFAHFIPLSSEKDLWYSKEKKRWYSVLTQCAGAQFYYTISCNCQKEKFYNDKSCGKCPNRATFDQKTGHCKC